MEKVKNVKNADESFIFVQMMQIKMLLLTESPNIKKKQFQHLNM